MPTLPIPLAHLQGPPDPARKYRLLELVRRRMRELRYSPRTIEAYVSWIRRYVLFHDRRLAKRHEQRQLRSRPVP